MCQEHSGQPNCSYLVQLAGQPFSLPTIGENQQNMIGKERLYWEYIDDFDWFEFSRRTRVSCYLPFGTGVPLPPRFPPNIEVTCKPKAE